MEANTIVKTKKSLKTSAKQSKFSEQKPKSKIALFREKYPFGLGYEILDMRAVLR